MLNKDEFDVLNYVRVNKYFTQRNISTELNISLGKINKLVATLTEKGYITGNKEITSKGLQALKPYKVSNAIILAAGFASRCAPLSYEKPKGLFKVRDEILIERQIMQLKER